MIDFVSICAGIGGFDLGLERAGWRCVGQIEIDSFCRKVLAKHWPAVVRLGDLKLVAKYPFMLEKMTNETLRRYESTAAPIRAFCGGYPCQPFSQAGQRRGEEDDRHLWPFIFPLIKVFRPDVCFFENVFGHVRMGLDSVLSDLESEGYDTQALIIPACAVNAPHRRDRIWLVSYADCFDGNAKGYGASKIQINGSTPENRCVRRAKRKAQSLMGGSLDGFPGRVERNMSELWAHGEWEDDLHRVANKIPNHTKRLKSLGNAVVPQLVETLGRFIEAALVENNYEHYFC